MSEVGLLSFGGYYCSWGIFSSDYPAVGVVCTATALVSIFLACGLACLRLMYVRYERDIAHAHAHWEKCRRQLNTLEKYFALFWWGEMVRESGKRHAKNKPAEYACRGYRALRLH